MLIVIFYLFIIIIEIQCFHRFSNNILPKVRIIRSTNEFTAGNNPKLVNNYNGNAIISNNNLGVSETRAHIWYDLENAIEDNIFLTFPRNKLILLKEIINLQKLFIRESYETLFNYIKYEIEFKNRNGFLVTGTPGIGKSVFAYYAIREFIKLTTNKLNELYYGRQILYQYEPNVVYWIRPDGTFEIKSYLESTNKLFDNLLSDSRNILFCDMKSPVEPNTCKGVTIITSSPDNRRYNEFLKSAAPVARYILNPFSYEEMLQLYNSSYNDKLSLSMSSFEDLYSKYGGNPRNVLNIKNYEEALKFMQDSLNDANTQLVPMLSAFERQSFDNSIIDLIIHLRSDTLKYVDSKLVCASKYVEDYLFKSLSEKMFKEVNKKVKFSTDPIEQSSVGADFEIRYHDIIRNSGIDELVRLENYRDYIGKNLSNSTSRFDNTEYWLNSTYVNNLDLIVYKNISTVKIMENLYYRPEKRNQASLDSFLIINNTFYGFQITTAMKHNVIIAGLIEVQAAISKSVLKDLKEYHLVFVVPKKSDIVKHKSLFTAQKFYKSKNEPIENYKDIPEEIRDFEVNQWLGLIDVDKRNR